jgi:hypothetical protein
MDASDGRPTIVEDARDGRFEGLGVSNSRFIQTWDRLATSPPLLQRGHPERTGYWLGAVPSDGLVEREVIEVAARDASVVFDKSQQDLGVPVGIEDAFKNDIEAPVERETGSEVDQGGCVPTNLVTRPEDLSLHHVLANDSN